MSTPPNKPPSHDLLLVATELPYRPEDVLSGRGYTRTQPGNARLQELVSMKQDAYHEAKTWLEQTQICQSIARAIKSDGGRFLTQDLRGEWTEIPHEKVILGVVKRAFTKASNPTWAHITAPVVPAQGGAKGAKLLKKLGDIRHGKTPAPDESPATRPEGTIAMPTEFDVLSGRGRATYYHPGNMNYREMTEEFALGYCSPTAMYKEKDNIIKMVNQLVKNEGGRFLKYVKRTDSWVVLGDSEAREKTCQALRDYRRSNRKEVASKCKPTPFFPPINEGDRSTVSVDDGFNENDVLLGRGHGLNNIGNHNRRERVQARLEEYIKSGPHYKAAIAAEIVKEIQHAGGRFLKESTTEPGVWKEIDDLKARDKISQSFRDLAKPSQQGKLLPGSGSPSPKKRKRPPPERALCSVTVDDFNENDVLMGRGYGRHSGNSKSRKRVEARLEEFQASSELYEKAAIADKVVKEIQDAGGRFLKDSGNGVWNEISNLEARSKICKSFRDTPKHEVETSSSANPTSGGPTQDAQVMNGVDSDSETETDTDTDDDNDSVCYPFDAVAAAVTKKKAPHSAPANVPSAAVRGACKTKKKLPTSRVNAPTDYSVRDVLFDADGGMESFAENEEFNIRLGDCRSLYLQQANAENRERIAMSIVQLVREKGGRFLKYDEATKLWKKIGNIKARDRIMERLVDGLPLPTVAAAQEPRLPAIDAHPLALAAARMLLPAVVLPPSKEQPKVGARKQHPKDAPQEQGPVKKQDSTNLIAARNQRRTALAILPKPSDGKLQSTAVPPSNMTLAPGGLLAPSVPTVSPPVEVESARTILPNGGDSRPASDASQRQSINAPVKFPPLPRQPSVAKSALPTPQYNSRARRLSRFHPFRRPPSKDQQQAPFSRPASKNQQQVPRFDTRKPSKNQPQAPRRDYRRPEPETVPLLSDQFGPQPIATAYLKTLQIPTQSSEAKALPPSKEGFTDFASRDILCGRGGLTNNHDGNIFLRAWVEKVKPQYLETPKYEKSRLAMMVVHIIRETGGRFLKQDDRTALWCDVGDIKARDKISQGLREVYMMLDGKRSRRKLSAEEQNRV